jgi:hypothetical protein
MIKWGIHAYSLDQALAQSTHAISVNHLYFLFLETGDTQACPPHRHDSGGPPIAFLCRDIF